MIGHRGWFVWPLDSKNVYSVSYFKSPILNDSVMARGLFRMKKDYKYSWTSENGNNGRCCSTKAPIANKVKEYVAILNV